MADQPERDLPPPPAPPALSAAAGCRPLFAGFSGKQIMLGALALAVFAWAMWMTRAVLTPQRDHIVSARLSSIVGDYVQAQTRSGSPPDQVEAEMRNFLSSLDKELERRSAHGQLVLVGEAVLTRNVPDITDRLKAAVYASGVPYPRQAVAQDRQRQEQMNPATRARPAAPSQLMAPFAPTAALDPMAVAQAIDGSQGPLPRTGPPAAPAASVSTFGVSDGGQ